MPAGNKLIIGRQALPRVSGPEQMAGRFCFLNGLIKACGPGPGDGAAAASLAGTFILAEQLDQERSLGPQPERL